MFQVRFHGRGGQGVVTAAELLASAAFREDRYAQAFPSFGSERMGAPVMSFCRIDDKPIRTREPVTEPDALLIQDLTLLHLAGLDGLRPDGYVLVNSTAASKTLASPNSPPAGPPPYRPGHAGARQPGPPAARRALLGGFAALTWAVSLDSVLAAINERFAGKVAEGNAAAARAAFDFVRDEREPGAHSKGRGRCSSRSRDPARWPRRWRCAGRR